MRTKTLIAAGVFVALLIAAIVILTRSAERGMSRVSFAEIQTDAVDRLELSGKYTVKLAKKDGTWLLESGKPADPDAIKRALEGIHNVQSSDQVTRQKDRFAELEVDDATGTRVQAFTGAKKLADFVVGKSAAGGSYLLADGGVYKVARLYPGTFARDAAGWLKKKLFEDKLEDVTKLEVHLAGQPAYTLVKKDDNWALEDPSVMPRGMRYDASAARALVSSLVTVQAGDLLDKDPGAETTGLSDASDLWAFTLKGSEDGKTPGARRELRLGKAREDKSVYGQKVGGADVFVLPEYAARNLRKSVSDFRDLKVMDFDRTKVKKLNIVDGAMSLAFEKQGTDWKVAKSTEAIPKDFELDSGAVDRRVSALWSARATKAADGVSPAKAGLASPKSRVSATLEDGSTKTLVFGSETKDDSRDVVYLRGNADSLTYLAATYMKKSLTGGLSTFKKRAGGGEGGLENLDPKALQNLPPDVRASLMQQIAQKRKQKELLDAIEKKTKK